MSELSEKDERCASQMYALLLQTLDDIGYHYQQNDEERNVHFEVHGDGLPMELTISIDGERDLIRLLSFLPFKVPENRVQDMALGVCRINDVLINGNFDLGAERGRLSFRMVQSYRDSLIDMEVLKYMIFVSLNTIDEYSEKLFLLSRRHITLDELENDEDEPPATGAGEADADGGEGDA